MRLSSRRADAPVPQNDLAVGLKAGDLTGFQRQTLADGAGLDHALQHRHFGLLLRLPDGERRTHRFGFAFAAGDHKRTRRVFGYFEKGFAAKQLDPPHRILETECHGAVGV